MVKKESLWEALTKGLVRENPLFVLVLGTCPSLAITTSVENAVGMGVAFTFVLLGSNIIISATRKIIPSEVRIPCFILVIATFGTMVDLLIKAFSPQLSESLGIFIPLIVVNCIVLGRAEAYASRAPVLKSTLDAIGMGAGYTMALLLISSVREMLGSGGVSLMGATVNLGFNPAKIMLLSPGAFLTLGLALGVMNYMRRNKE